MKFFNFLIVFCFLIFVFRCSGIWGWKSLDVIKSELMICRNKINSIFGKSTL
jgi:hypothetical protein